jgi:REP element-mobilizing transposase RayT
VRPSDSTPPHERATYGRSHAVRLPDYDYKAGATIHVTIVAETGRRLAPALAKAICDSIETSCRLSGFRLYGYCLMPDHVHVLLDPQAATPLGDWLRRFKSFTTKLARDAGVPNPLWQRSAHDHVCREGETAEVVLRYIAENPVRAGLVARWEDWPWTRLCITI